MTQRLGKRFPPKMKSKKRNNINSMIPCRAHIIIPIQSQRTVVRRSEDKKSRQKVFSKEKISENKSCLKNSFITYFVLYCNTLYTYIISTYFVWVHSIQIFSLHVANLRKVYRSCLGDMTSECGKGKLIYQDCAQIIFHTFLNF